MSSLKIKVKWLSPIASVKLGTLAILKEDNIPPIILQWRMVRITILYPGKYYGIIRIVTVRTASGLHLKRLMVKIILCSLPTDEDD